MKSLQISDHEAAHRALAETPPHFSDGRTIRFGGCMLTWQTVARALEIQGADATAAEKLALALRPPVKR